MKRFTTILIILALGLVLLQCGGGDKEQAPAKSQVSTAPAKAASNYEYDLANGEAIYKKYCFACHDNGIAGAAKHSDTQRWAESAAKGLPTLIKHVTEGYTGTHGILPPKGTCMECGEQDLIDAVHYQLKMGGSLE